jgi:hypothetical protein
MHPPSGLDACPVFDAVIGQIGIFEPRLSQAIVGFYHYLTVLPGQLESANQAINESKPEAANTVARISPISGPSMKVSGSPTSSPRSWRR